VWENFVFSFFLTQVRKHYYTGPEKPISIFGASLPALEAHDNNFVGVYGRKSMGGGLVHAKNHWAEVLGLSPGCSELEEEEESWRRGGEGPLSEGHREQQLDRLACIFVRSRPDEGQQLSR